MRKKINKFIFIRYHKQDLFVLLVVKVRTPEDVCKIKTKVLVYYYIFYALPCFIVK